MTPAARLQAAIELLDEVIGAARKGGAAADTLIARYFQTRRYAGSKDRRAVRSYVYAAIRSLGERPKSGRAAMLGHARAHDPALLDLFGLEGHAPPPIVAGEPEAQPGLAPAWLMTKLRAQFGENTKLEVAALLDRAPLDVRINTLKEGPIALQDAELIPYLSNALRLTADIQIERDPTYLEGRIEVQDAGSQLACLAAEARPGETVIDLCAGAGGKTLALAAAMTDKGRILACDTDRGRLSRLPPRAARAGASCIETRLLDPNREAAALADIAGTADLVVVDAPCSGTGTWRRNPEARWRLTPQRLDALTALQARLLDLAATLLKPGGRLLYIVCSLLPEEGAGQADRLAATHPGLAPSPLRLPTMDTAASATLLTPYRHQTDGFFIARWQKL